MDRTFFGFLLGSLLGFSSLAALAFSDSSYAPKSGKPAGDWRLLDPVTYENLTVFPVVSSNIYDTSGFLTLDEGLATGEVLVREQGSEGMARNRDVRDGILRPTYSTGASVNQLVLINRSKRPLLLLAGELVSGGKQDRIIGKDRLVPVGADPLPLDVFCVEHGRWSAGASFTKADTIVHPSVREQATVDRDQARVWSAVRSGTTAAVSAEQNASAPAAVPALGAPTISRAIEEDAPTESYQKIYESRTVRNSADVYVAEIRRRFSQITSGVKGEHVVGVIVAYGREVAWSDIFASGYLFQQYWNKLLRSYVVEALARPGYRQVASRNDAEEFLRQPNGRVLEETDPGVYRWRQINEGRLSLIELDALDPKILTLHRLFIRRTN
jgi:hypothetical protein